MSVSRELQKFIYDLLLADDGIRSLVGNRVYDAPPATIRYPFIGFGPSDTIYVLDDCIEARTESFQVDVYSNYKGGRSECKAIVDAIVTCLKGASGELQTSPEETRVIELSIFLSRVFDGPDGIQTRGVVTVQANVDG